MGEERESAQDDGSRARVRRDRGAQHCLPFGLGALLGPEREVDRR